MFECLNFNGMVLEKWGEFRNLIGVYIGNLGEVRIDSHDN